MKNLRRFNESTEYEINRILDKISDSGINSLSKEERLTLDRFNGKYDDVSSTDKMSFDKDGNILINGVSYSEWQNRQKNPNQSSNELSKVQKSNTPKIFSTFYDRLKNNHTDYEILNNDDDMVVCIDNNVTSYRIYYIYFKKIEDNSKAKVIKMRYNTNSRNHNPFQVYDNYNNQLQFNKLEGFLQQNNLTYRDFNNAWYYIEEHFNNQGYS